jgi:hypothetical protein
MRTTDQYKAAIQQLGWDGLQALWEKIESRTTAPEWASGKAFEYLILRAFELDGAEVQWPYSVPIQGMEVEQIDGAVHVRGLSFSVESKDFGEENVPIGPIAKLRNQINRRPLGTFGVVFSRTGFTDPAVLLLQYSSPPEYSVVAWPRA